jgi:hypothetical protein
MKTTAERYLAAMENQLSEVTINSSSLTAQYRASILICKKAMMKLKSYISSYSFENEAEEIHFFKELKPLFYSKYIYFINVYNFLMQMPAGGEEAIRSYINFQLRDLQRFFDSNKAFYQYYRSGGCLMDTIYFTRGGFDVQMELEDFEEDEQYSTSHDYKLSKIMANEKYQDYLNLELVKPGAVLTLPLNTQKIFPFDHPVWTAAMIDAVELIYSLKASGSVNNGNIDISELVALWEFIFQIELKEYYHKFLDIGRRKKEVPVFLSKLKEALLRWVYDKAAMLAFSLLFIFPF